jgi:hypothetical protein
MLKKLLPLIALLIAFLAVGSVAAQTAVSATITPDQEALTVGDPIELTIQVTHPAGTQAIMPQLEPNWGDFIVRGQSPATTTNNSDGSVTTSQTIDARLFAPGAFQTPPLPIILADAAGQTSQIQAAPINLMVQSVLVEGDTELRDIKPQAALPLPFAWPWLLTGFSLMAFAVWLFARQIRQSIDNRLPHEVALDALAEVERQKLAENGRFKPHYSLITDTLRQYVEQTQGIPATDRTTAELRRELEQTTLTEEQTQQFIDLLQIGDLVKFARVTPTAINAAEHLTQARRFIEATKPAVENSPRPGRSLR